MALTYFAGHAMSIITTSGAGCTEQIRLHRADPADKPDLSPHRQDDAVGVGPAAVVVHAPAIGGLGECLLVHHRAQHVEWQALDRRGDSACQQPPPVADLADFEGDEPARTHHAGELLEPAADEAFPGG